MLIGNGQDLCLNGSQPGGEGPCKVFDENTDKALNGAKGHSVNHNGTVFFSICPDVFTVKPQRKLEIKLNGTALPGPSDGILQVEINLGTIEGSVSLIHHIGKSQVVQGASESLCSHLPILIASHRIFRPGGKLHVIFKPEKLINLINQLGNALDLFSNLFRHHKDMSIVLGKAAHPHQTVELT